MTKNSTVGTALKVIDEAIAKSERSALNDRNRNKHCGYARWMFVATQLKSLRAEVEKLDS